jgi:two-component system, chemotaxis family, protein-glutamate methylesterase/glutaminase
VVALVASVGGLDALGQVLAPLPAGFPAAVVALQHVRPEHPSRLAESSAAAPPSRSSPPTTVLA